MVAAASDNRSALEVEQRSSREQPASFLDDLVSCVSELHK